MSTFKQTQVHEYLFFFNYNELKKKQVKNTVLPQDTGPEIISFPNTIKVKYN